MLKNGNKNRWNLPCGELLLSFIPSFWENSLPHLSYLTTLLLRKGEEDYFSPKLGVHIKDNNNSPYGKFYWFLFPFSRKFSDLHFTSYVLYIYPFAAREKFACHLKWTPVKSLSFATLKHPCQTFLCHAKEEKEPRNATRNNNISTKFTLEETFPDSYTM